MLLVTRDGGGIRGRIPARITAAISGALNRPVHDWAQMQAGTSIGGIEALAYSLGLPESTVSGLFDTIGDRAFKKRWWGSRIFPPIYSRESLDGMLQEIFGARMMGQCLIPTMIFSARIADFSEMIWKSWQHMMVPAWEIAAGTSAAPTFWAPFKGYMDGGVWANNPTIYALIEAFKLGTAAKDLRVLSLGCGKRAQSFSPIEAAHWGYAHWGPLLPSCLMDIGMSAADHVAAHLLPAGNYLRIQPDLGYISPAMDDASPGHRRDLDELADRTIGDRLEEIVSFVKNDATI